MANLIPEVDRINKAMRMGWPEGTYELHREIPILLNRISELENALAPFARVAVLESQNNTPNHNTPNPDRLVYVYLKHCLKALEKIDAKQGTRKKEDDFFSMPAEG